MFERGARACAWHVRRARPAGRVVARWLWRWQVRPRSEIPGATRRRRAQAATRCRRPGVGGGELGWVSHCLGAGDHRRQDRGERTGNCVSAVSRASQARACLRSRQRRERADRNSTRLNSSHLVISYAVFCLKKKKIKYNIILIKKKKKKKKKKK